MAVPCRSPAEYSAQRDNEARKFVHLAKSFASVRTLRTKTSKQQHAVLEFSESQSAVKTACMKRETSNEDDVVGYTGGQLGRSWYQ